MVIYHFVYPSPGQSACASSPKSLSFFTSFLCKLREDLKGRVSLPPNPFGLALSSISTPNLYFGTVFECTNGSIQVIAYAIAAKRSQFLAVIAFVGYVLLDFCLGVDRDKLTRQKFSAWFQSQPVG